MLKTLVQLERSSGGMIPEGAIIAYKIMTAPFSKKISIVYEVYYNAQAIIDKKPHLTQDILLFKTEKGQINAANNIEVNDTTLQNLNPSTFVNLTDTIALSVLEEHFLGENSCEKIGDQLPE